MLRDQQEAVDKGQERAALARKKAQEEIAAAAGEGGGGCTHQFKSATNIINMEVFFVWKA